MEFSVENMCRTCMNEEGPMHSVYDTGYRVEINMSYADMLMYCAQVQIDEDDALPKLICQHCLKQLVAAFHFKQLTETSAATLREITKNPSIEYIKEEISDASDDLNVKFVDSDPEETDNHHETDDFKLKAEYLDDDFRIEENYSEIEDSKSDEFQMILQTLQQPQMHFSDDLEQLKLPKPRPRLRMSNLTCQICDLHFKSKLMFRNHKKVHKTQTCDRCGKEFRSAHGLRYHMKIHNNIKNFECHFENCHKKFRLKQALDKHLSIHNNEKNHLCPLCGKTYCTYDALHYHLKTHRGERPHLCVHCGKTFKQSCHLKSHMWIHSGIKPHVCKSCGKCYTSGHQLKKHLRKYCNNTVNNDVKTENETIPNSTIVTIITAAE